MFKVRDAVFIKGYGVLYGTSKVLDGKKPYRVEDGVYYYDIAPWLVGSIAFIKSVFPSDYEHYGIVPVYGIDVKGWGLMYGFKEEQLELVRDEKSKLDRRG